MKRVVFTIMLLPTFVSNANCSNSNDIGIGKGYLSKCEILKGDTDIMTGVCIGFLQGVWFTSADYYNLFNMEYPNLPSNFTIRQAHSIVIKYLKNNPKNLYYSSASLILNALIEEYGVKEQQKLKSSDKIFKEQDIKEKQDLKDYRTKVKEIEEIISLVEEYKAMGGDTSIFQKEIDKFYSQNEIGYGEKLRIFVSNLPLRYINGFKDLIGSEPIELSHSQKMDEAKWEREEVINPIKTMLMKILLDPFFLALCILVYLKLFRKTNKR